MTTISTSLSPHQPRGLTLFCWILGISDRSFSVKIKDDQTVDDLKDAAVKKKPLSFQGVDPDELDLWKTSIPIDKQLKNHVSNQQFLEKDVLLEGMRLSRIFPPPGPAEETLHIVVQHPRPPKRLHLEGQGPFSGCPNPPFNSALPDLSLFRAVPTSMSGSPEPPSKHVRLELPQTPVNRNKAPPGGTYVSPPRLPRQQFEPSMTEALQLFVQYITDLAEGKFDSYFDSIEPGALATKSDIKPPNRPILLLHSLGNNQSDPRLARLFRSDTVHLFAVTGSGKTRLCLEGLCHKWGLYISCKGGTMERRGSGSRDFTSATEKMSSMSTWHQSTGDNVDAAHRAFAMLICARVFVLKCLLQKIPKGTSAEKARRRWVLLQVIPPSDGLEDVFSVVLETLRGAHKIDMIDFTRTMLRGMQTSFGPEFFPRQGLFAVVDEAQVAAEYLNGSFRSTSTEERPVLHPFFKFLWDTELFQGVILAGTGLSMKMVRSAVASHGGARLQFRQNPFVFVEVGRFMKNGKEHTAYINTFLHLSESDSDQRLRDRISYWFHGRYRFTADLMELLLCAPPGSSHRILSAFVHRLTGFNLTDATDLEEGEPAIPIDICDQIEHYGHLVGKKIFNYHHIVNYVFHAVMLWRIRSQSTSIRINADMHLTIAAGIGHLDHVSPSETFDEKTVYPVYLCEPLVVLHLSSIFSKQPSTTIEAWITDAARTASNNLTLGFVLEEAILLVLLETFGGKECALSDVFDTDQPWGSRKVTLVSLKRGTDGRMWSFPVSWDSGSSDRLGYKASNAEDVVKFLNNPDGKCFLFPDNHMGPDVSCFFQDVLTKELIFLSLQSKLSKKLSAEAALGALASVNPDFFYNLNKNGDRVVYAPSKHPGLFDDVMGALIPKIGEAEYKPSIEGIREKLRSTTKTNHQFASQLQRATPRFLSIIATRDTRRIELFKADSKGSFGVLRWNRIDQLFGDVMWDSAPCVH